MSERLQRSSLNMLASMGGYVVPVAANILAIPLLLQWLDPVAFGLQSMVSVVIGYMAVIDMGLETAVVKLLAEDRALDRKAAECALLNTALTIYLVIGAIGCGILVLGASWLVENVFGLPLQSIPEAINVFRLTGVGFVGALLLSWGRAWSMGLQRYDIAYGVASVSSIASVASGLIALNVGWGVTGFVAARVIANLGAGLFYVKLAERYFPGYGPHIRIDQATLARLKPYLGYGAFNRAFSSIAYRIDQTLLGVWFGVAAAGVYSVPFLVATSVGYAISYMLGFMLPLTSELQSRGELVKLQTIFLDASRFIALLATVVFVPLLVLTKPLFQLWVPGIADQAAPAFFVLGIATYVSVLAVALPNYVAQGLGRIRAFTMYVTARNIVLCLAALFLIRRFGVEGAAFTVACGCIADLFFFRLSVRSFLSLEPALVIRTAYVVPVLLGFVVGTALHFCIPTPDSWAGLAVAYIISMIAYAVTAFALGQIGDREFSSARNLVMRIKAILK